MFSLDPTTGAEAVVYSFQGGKDGVSSFASLIKVGGRLYGTTFFGGTFGDGTVFSVSLKTGAERVEHSFGGGSYGFYTYAGLINVGGTLYGTTEYGGGSNNCSSGPGGCGTVFAVTP